jgi:hypothetical protein
MMVMRVNYSLRVADANVDILTRRRVTDMSAALQNVWKMGSIAIPSIHVGSAVAEPMQIMARLAVGNVLNQESHVIKTLPVICAATLHRGSMTIITNADAWKMVQAAFQAKTATIVVMAHTTTMVLPVEVNACLQVLHVSMVRIVNFAVAVFRTLRIGFWRKSMLVAMKNVTQTEQAVSQIKAVRTAVMVPLME